MSSNDVKAEVKGDTLHLEIPLSAPEPSKSGKMLLLNSSGGFVKLNAKCPKTGKQISGSWNFGVSNK